MSLLLALWLRQQQLEAAHADSDADTLSALSWPSIKESLWQGCQLDMLWTLAKIGLPGGFMVAMEAGSFDLTTALAGTLGVVQVDAHVAMLGIVYAPLLSSLVQSCLWTSGMSVAVSLQRWQLLEVYHCHCLQHSTRYHQAIPALGHKHLPAL